MNKVFGVIEAGTDAELLSMFWFYSAGSNDLGVARERMALGYQFLASRYEQRSGIWAKLRLRLCNTLISYLQMLGDC